MSSGYPTKCQLNYNCISDLDQLLPPEVELIHGPGCPVCVAGAETIDRAIM